MIVPSGILFVGSLSVTTPGQVARWLMSDRLEMVTPPFGPPTLMVTVAGTKLPDPSR